MWECASSPTLRSVTTPSRYSRSGLNEVVRYSSIGINPPVPMVTRYHFTDFGFSLLPHRNCYPSSLGTNLKLLLRLLYEPGAAMSAILDRGSLLFASLAVLAV